MVLYWLDSEVSYNEIHSLMLVCNFKENGFYGIKTVETENKNTSKIQDI